MTPIRVQIISTEIKLKREYDCVHFFGLVYCVNVCLSPALHNIFHTLMARYSLFVLKVQVNTNQLINNHSCCC